jgi:nucleotide-binding universal stress UspA family protein
MFEKVIWATDGSGAADTALSAAKEVVQASGGELIVVHAVEVIGPHEEGTGEPMRRDEGEHRAKIEEQVAALSREGITASFEAPSCRIGAVAQAIADFAKERGADVIVVGTRGHTVVSGLFAGSVSMRLLHASSVPILAVPPQLQE